MYVCVCVNSSVVKKSKLLNLFSFIIRTLWKMFFIQNSNREAATETAYKPVTLLKTNFFKPLMPGGNKKVTHI